MTPIKNPISGEVRQASPLEAKRLLSYGWERITLAQYQEAKREILSYVVARRLKHVKITLN